MGKEPEDFDFVSSGQVKGTQVGGFLKGIAEGFINSKLPTWFGHLVEWMRTADDERVHIICGKLDLEQAKILKRFIEIVRSEFT